MSLIPWRRKREVVNGGTSVGTLPSIFPKEIDSGVERFLRDPWCRGQSGPLGWLSALPRMDLAESQTHVTVCLELPGVDPVNVRLSITGNVLTVRGEKKHQREESKRSYHYVERQFGQFQRDVQLPSSVDPDRIDASYRDGLLIVRIAKHPEARPRRVAVKAQ